MAGPSASELGHVEGVIARKGGWEFVRFKPPRCFVLYNFYLPRYMPVPAIHLATT